MDPNPVIIKTTFEAEISASRKCHSAYSSRVLNSPKNWIRRSITIKVYGIFKLFV